MSHRDNNNFKFWVVAPLSLQPCSIPLKLGSPELVPSYPIIVYLLVGRRRNDNKKTIGILTRI